MDQWKTKLFWCNKGFTVGRLLLQQFTYSVHVSQSALPSHVLSHTTPDTPFPCFFMQRLVDISPLAKFSWWLFSPSGQSQKLKYLESNMCYCVIPMYNHCLWGLHGHVSSLPNIEKWNTIVWLWTSHPCLSNCGSVTATPMDIHHSYSILFIKPCLYFYHHPIHHYITLCFHLSNHSFIYSSLCPSLKVFQFFYLSHSCFLSIVCSLTLFFVFPNLKNNQLDDCSMLF